MDKETIHTVLYGTKKGEQTTKICNNLDESEKALDKTHTQRLHSVWFHLHEVLEKTKLLWQKADEQVQETKWKDAWENFWV